MMNPLPLVLPSPLPTPAPSLELGQSLGLELRDLVANPCGWTDADINRPCTCADSGQFCTKDYTTSVFGCCPSSQECTLPTVCIDQANVCTTCSSRPGGLLCLPYCALNLLRGFATLTSYDCVSSSSVTNYIYTSYSDQGSRSGSSAGTNPTTPSSISGSGSDSPVASPTAQVSSGPSSSSLITVIAVLAGLLGVAFFGGAVGLIVWMVRHKRKKRNKDLGRPYMEQVATNHQLSQQLSKPPTVPSDSSEAAMTTNSGTQFSSRPHGT